MFFSAKTGQSNDTHTGEIVEAFVVADTTRRSESVHYGHGYICEGLIENGLTMERRPEMEMDSEEGNYP